MWQSWEYKWSQLFSRSRAFSAVCLSCHTAIFLLCVSFVTSSPSVWNKRFVRPLQEWSRKARRRALLGKSRNIQIHFLGSRLTRSDRSTRVEPAKRCRKTATVPQASSPPGVSSRQFCTWTGKGFWNSVHMSRPASARLLIWRGIAGTGPCWDTRAMKTSKSMLTLEAATRLPPEGPSPPNWPGSSLFLSARTYSSWTRRKPMCWLRGWEVLATRGRWSPLGLISFDEETKKWMPCRSGPSKCRLGSRNCSPSRSCCVRNQLPKWDSFQSASDTFQPRGKKMWIIRVFPFAQYNLRRELYSGWPPFPTHLLKAPAKKLLIRLD